jgi:homoserine dehydrogenase
VDGVMNGIVVRGNAIGDVMFYGAGAGKLPTASAVVADIIDAAKHDKTRKLISWNSGSSDMMRPSSELKNRWYVRVTNNISSILELAEPRDISSLFESAESSTAQYGFITREELTKSEIDERTAKFNVLSLFRVLGE